MHARQTRIWASDYVLAIQGGTVLAEFRPPPFPLAEFDGPQTTDRYAHLILADLDGPLTPAALRFRQALDQLDAAARELIETALFPENRPF